MPADETTLAAGRSPQALVRGAGLTAAVLAGGVVGHCLAGGHVPGPAVLAAVGSLVLVTGVLAARSLLVRAGAPAATPDAASRGAAPSPVARAAAALAAAGLAVALHPVLALLAEPVADAGTVRAPGHAAHGDAPGAAVDLTPLLAAGIDLDAVRAAGTDLEALVAAGLDGPTLAAAGMDPDDPHAPHVVAGLVAAADRARAAGGPPVAPEPAPPAVRSPAPAPRAVAVAAGAALTAALAGSVLLVPARRRRPPGALPSGSGRPPLAA
ncbi:hypothetical protein J1G42_02470 [Cellulomonas sp. zg-ZUI222]|uniref:hypothetical protein n=1 Tax=Cellulomonas wangleii TaxID=2816956 RepID=UPI001A9419AC|nr:hypothetical protein [Cellulomonas wangleii]MBO0919688.1 hypothetical protein [Cellulomonas wangleii]